MQEQTMRVLVVEDEFLICDMIECVLNDHGFEVRSVGTAREALAYISEGGSCDLLFTDVNLPGEFDGEVLAHRVRALRPNLPVVYATGSVTRLCELKAVSGAVLVPKPYSPEKVCELLRNLIVQVH